MAGIQGKLEAYSYVIVSPKWDVHVNDLPEGKIEGPETRLGPLGVVLRKVSFWFPESWLEPVSKVEQCNVVRSEQEGE